MTGRSSIVLGGLLTLAGALNAQEEATARCYLFHRHYFWWVGRPPSGGPVFHDSTALILLSPDQRPPDRFLRGPSDARGLVPPAMRIDSNAARRWLRSSYWRPISADSLEVVWRNGLAGPVFRLVVRADSLRGRVRFTTDVVGAEKPPEPATAMHVDCPDSSGAPSNPRLDADGRSNGERPRAGWRRRDR